MVAVASIKNRYIRGRFLFIAVLLILFPCSVKNEQVTVFTFFFTAQPSQSDDFSTKSEPVFSPSSTDTSIAFTQPIDAEQASSTYRSPTKKTTEATAILVVSTQVQAENLFDQGYSVNDIARELALSKKEVRKLKRRLKKEERAAIQQKKRDKKKG